MRLLARLACVVVVSLSCLVASCVQRTVTDLGDLPAVMPDMSGLAWIGDGSYITVHDEKDIPGTTGCRVSVLTITTSPPGCVYQTVSVDWTGVGGRSSDLESACPIPDRPGEFLLGESGYYGEKYGRIFHVRVTRDAGNISVTMLGAARLPTFTAEVEGIACVGRDGRYVLFLGERGSKAGGRLRWGTLDLTAPDPVLDVDPKNQISLQPIFAGGTAPERACTDLYAAPDGTLWSAVADDPGNSGPFRSGVYAIGKLTGNAASPITPGDMTLLRAFSGAKIEGISRGLADGTLGVCTDNESYGGQWSQLDLK
jgi:hypothetical protein